MKKLALYVHHDPKGDVRDYILYCLNGLKEVVDDILFIVNGQITSKARRDVEALGVQILVRENEGFDWWAWKAGLEFYGYDKIAEYDELLLTNNTYYGPIYPFSEMWAEMDKRDCDFWGISRHPEMDIYIENNPKNKVFEFIQSFWIVFRKRILRSYDFENYWKNIHEQNSYQEMLGYGETKLTKYFEDHGFSSSVYIDFEVYKKLLYNPPFINDILVIRERCPILKRKFFFDYKKDILQYRSDFVSKTLLAYLSKHNLYDVDLIWQDLLATQPMSVINDCLHLNYILPTSLSRPNIKIRRTAVIMYIYPKELAEYCYQYATNIPEEMDIYVVNTSSEVQKECQNFFSKLPNKTEYLLQQNRGRDNAALLITCKEVIKKYDYLCFVHSKKSNHFAYEIQGDYFREHNFLSLLCSHDYIINIMELFYKNERLGILSPLIPNVGNYAHLICDKWTCNWCNTDNFIKDKMKLEIPLDKNIMGPFGNMFWCRTGALKTLLSYPWVFEDFPKEPLTQSDGLLTHVIERITSMLAQYDGYYTAWVAPDFYAEAYLNNFYYRYREECVPSGCIRSKDCCLPMYVLKLDFYNRMRDKFNYWRYKFLSKITFGKVRKKYKKKRKMLKSKLKFVKRALKG